MANVKFDVLEAKANINGSKYPMYTGFIQASVLMEIAEVPSFDKKKSHHRIADDVVDPPIDEWQRPEEKDKIQKIKEIYGDGKKDNLMANPVLLGTATQNISSPLIEVKLLQKTIVASNGQVIPIENFFEVEIIYEPNQKRPLWILDGQHRIKGISISKQKNEMIPFVLLHDSHRYTPPYLAEIFTHVTTGAKPMDPVHGEWMKFAFDLGNYKLKAHKMSMETTIALCRNTKFQNITNPFFNQIQFNPHLTKPKWHAFEFNSIEWEQIISVHYYAKQGKMSPIELAEEIVKATLSFEKLDSHKQNDSRIFSNRSHKILAEAFLIGLLTYLTSQSKPMSINDWDSFFLDPRRAVNRCNFSLPFVKTTGALSSNNGKPSKKIAINCFIDFFCTPNNLEGTFFTDFLQGIGGKFKIMAFSVKNGKIDKKSKIEKIIPFASGITSFDVSSGGIQRDIILLEELTPNMLLTSVSDSHFKPSKSLKSALKRNGENISNLPNNYEIDVEYMAYSGDTRQLTQIRIDK